MVRSVIGAVQKTPENKSYLYGDKFKLMIDELPFVEYFIRTAEIPGVSMDTATQPTPFLSIERPMNVKYDDLTISFVIDEDLRNYIELHEWLISIGEVHDFGEQRNWINDRRTAFADAGRDFTASQASIVTLTNTDRPNKIVSFKDIYPVSLSGISFDLEADESTPLVATASFKYLYYDFEVLNIDNQSPDINY